MTSFPKHIAFIMDGNRRWSRDHSYHLEKGYRQGASVVLDLIEHFIVRRVSTTLSFFAFSKENWKRPKKEVDLVFWLFCESLKKFFQRFEPSVLRVSFIGDREGLSEEVNDTMRSIEGRYFSPAPLHIVIALNYSGQWDIDQAVKKFCFNQEKGQLWHQYLQTASFPDLDLLIRTGKHERISNFFLYQLAYTELYFPEIYWPDFKVSDLQEILEDFSKRKRYFGAGEHVEIA